MADSRISDAVAALRDQFGAQLFAQRDEGRDMMVEALAEHLSIDDGEAKELVKVLEQARAIEWVQVDDAQDLVIGAPSTGQGMPLGGEGAFWRFGS